MKHFVYYQNSHNNLLFFCHLNLISNQHPYLRIAFPNLPQTNDSIWINNITV